MQIQIKQTGKKWRLQHKTLVHQMIWCGCETEATRERGEHGHLFTQGNVSSSTVFNKSDLFD